MLLVDELPSPEQPGELLGVGDQVLAGTPDRAHISTSYVERQNLKMRMGTRRFTRTNGLSKKVGRPRGPQRNSLAAVADRELITADDLDRMTPDQRAAAVRVSIVTDWDQVSPEVRARIEATAAALASQVDHRTAG